MRKSNLISRGMLVCTLILLAGCGNNGQKKKATGSRPVEVTRGDLQITVLATGNVQPNNELAIFPAISGRIEKINIKEGDTVRKGQRLMDMSSTERATLLDAARTQGPDVLAHWEQLYEETPVLSPENGQIIYLPTVPGQVVSTGVTLMVMSDHLMVNTQVDETDLAQVKKDQEATITLDAYPNSPFKGKVHRISYFSILVNNVTTYEVDVWPDQVPALMRSGMTANVVFNVSKKEDVLLIPSEALQQVDGQTGVMLAPAKKGDKPQFQAVQTGATDGKQVEVVSGLAEGDRVIIKTFSASQLAPAAANNNPLMPSGPPGGGSRGGGGGR